MASLNIYDWDREMTPELWSQLIDNTRQNSLDIERTLARKDQTTFIAHITANIFEIGDESLFMLQSGILACKRKRKKHWKTVSCAGNLLWKGIKTAYGTGT